MGSHICGHFSFGIRRNRELLDELAHFSGVAIQTPALRQLVTLAEQAGGLPSLPEQAAATVGLF